MLRRHEISDAVWDAIRDLLPGQEGDPGATAKDNRLFVNAIMWLAKRGAPWRDLPERFGKWNSVFQRFNRWCKTGVLDRIMEALKDPDLGDFSWIRPSFAPISMRLAHKEAPRKRRRWAVRAAASAPRFTWPATAWGSRLRSF